MRTNQDHEAHIRNYWNQLFGEDNNLKKQAKENSSLLKLQGISVSSMEAQIISFLIRQLRCKKFVEIGTLTGYSALWILEALPSDGRLWTFEKDPQHAALASQVLNHDTRVEIVIGDAKIELEKLKSRGPFDGIFIDGNKAAYPDYLAWAEQHIRVGGIIIADNIFLGGSVYGESDERFSDKQVQAMKKFNQRLADSHFYDSIFLPTAEGLFVAVKK